MLSLAGFKRFIFGIFIVWCFSISIPLHTTFPHMSKFWLLYFLVDSCNHPFCCPIHNSNLHLATIHKSSRKLTEKALANYSFLVAKLCGFCSSIGVLMITFS